MHTTSSDYRKFQSFATWSLINLFIVERMRSFVYTQMQLLQHPITSRKTRNQCDRSKD